MQLGCFAAALGFPMFLILTGHADAVSPTIVSLTGLFLICAGLLTSPTRRAKPDERPRSTRDRDNRDDRDDDDRDDGVDFGGIARRVRRVVRENIDWPDDDLRMAALG